MFGKKIFRHIVRLYVGFVQMKIYQAIIYCSMQVSLPVDIYQGGIPLHMVRTCCSPQHTQHNTGGGFSTQMPKHNRDPIPKVYSFQKEELTLQILLSPTNWRCLSVVPYRLEEGSQAIFPFGHSDASYTFWLATQRLLEQI